MTSGKVLQFATPVKVVTAKLSAKSEKSPERCNLAVMRPVIRRAA